MKTDWKELKDKAVLIKFKKRKYYFLRYYGFICERFIFEVSPSGKCIKIGLNDTTEHYGPQDWVEIKEVKLLDVL